LILEKEGLAMTEAPAHPCLLQHYYNSQALEAAQMPHTDEWIKKMWYLYNEVLFSYKEE
jgi:hypothetical protein